MFGKVICRDIIVFLLFVVLAGAGFYMLFVAGPVTVDKLAGRSVGRGPDSEAAWKRLLELAEQGNAEAQWRVASIYAIAKRNRLEADKWERRAAENGHPVAQQGIANHYLNMERNDEAIAWIRRWAKERKEWAEFKLGQLYTEGRGGLKKDYAEAMRWYEKFLYTHPALPGIDAADAYVRVGELNRIGGYGIEKDWVRAYACYRIAVRLHANAKWKLFPNPEPHIESLRKKRTREELSIADTMVKKELKGSRKIIRSPTDTDGGSR